MNVLASLLVGLVAVAHLGCLIIEMLPWTTPYALKSFAMTLEFAKTHRCSRPTKVSTMAFWQQG